MKKILFFTLLMSSVFSLELSAQVRATRGIGTRSLDYKLDGKAVSAENLSNSITGTLVAHYGRTNAQAQFIGGELIGPFSYRNVTGIANKDKSFLLNDSNESNAEGTITCPTLDTFKLFSYSLQTGSREDFYKCLVLNKASYHFDLGQLDFNGKVVYPSITEGSTVSFKPNLNLIKDTDKNLLLPKDVSISFGQDERKLDVDVITQKDQKVVVGIDLTENPLQLLNRFERNGNKAEAIKTAAASLSVTKVLVPRVDGKTGFLFDGSYNLVSGLKPSSQFNLFDSMGQKLIDVTSQGNAFSFFAKYPETLNLFLEGEVQIPNLSKGYLLATVLFSNQFKKTRFQNKTIARLLSGSALKNATFYTDDGQKLASLNITFSSKITEKDIAAIKKSPHLLDNFVSGRITFYKTPQGQLDVDFNESDIVTVNGVSDKGANQADFYGLVMMLPEFLSVSLERYKNQMHDILKETVLVNDVYNVLLKQMERNNILNIAKQYAHTTYDYCVKLLENEQINYMYECKGLDFSQIGKIKPVKGVQMSLVQATEMGIEHSFIYYDEKIGRDVVMLQLNFDDETVCNNVALSQNKKCENKTFNIGIQTELKTY